MLEAINLSEHYNGTVALDSLDLEIEPGEVFCLLGANGAGKTTTINLFLNFIEPTSGKAMIKGLDVTKEPLETKRYIAYIPEQVTLYKNLSGLENLEYFSAWPGTKSIRASSCSSFLKRSGCSVRSPTSVFQPTRKACDRRLASRSRWRRRLKRCCSTSRLPVSTRKRRTSFQRY